MKISIVVCSIGRNSLLDCLNSLTSQEYGNHEILVVSFKDSIKEEVEKFGAKFIFSPKANVSFQRNLGILKSEGEFVCFIDDDAFAEKNWVGTLMKGFTEEKVACVGGKIKLIIKEDIPEILRNLDENTLKGFLGETLLGDERKELNKPLLWGSNICFKKEVFDEIGYFDEKIGRTPQNMICNEDVEIQERILRRGLKIIYEPKAIVWHIISKEKLTVNYFLERSFWQGYSDVLAARRSENMMELVKFLEKPFLNFLLKEKVFENIFDSIISKNLNDKILHYKKIGRNIGLLELARNE